MTIAFASRMLRAGLILGLLAASPAHASNWTVDKGESRLGFSVNVEPPGSGSQRMNGRFERWDAEIEFDPAQPDAARLRVDIEIDSAVTTRRTFDNEMKGGAWLDAGTFPTATYEADGFKPVSAGRWRADGTLTLRGVSVRVPLIFDLAVQGDRALAEGEAMVRRLDFGIGTGSRVSDAATGVEVTFRITAMVSPDG